MTQQTTLTLSKSEITQRLAPFMASNIGNVVGGYLIRGLFAKGEKAELTPEQLSDIYMTAMKSYIADMEQAGLPVRGTNGYIMECRDLLIQGVGPEYLASFTTSNSKRALETIATLPGFRGGRQT